jgi:hypothetical protein
LVYKSNATKSQQIPSIYNANNVQQNPISVASSSSFIPSDTLHLQHQIQQQSFQFTPVDIEIPTNILHSEDDLNIVQNTFNTNDINNTNNDNTTNINNNNTDEDWEIFFNS